ncbi:hypothetical protein D3C87_1403320 [compost metagenome]
MNLWTTSWQKHKKGHPKVAKSVNRFALLLAHAGTAQGGWGEVGAGGLEVEIVEATLLVGHAKGQITTGLQVVQGFQGVEGDLM